MDTICTPDTQSSSQQPRRFLKRGEGVQKRVFGPQIRKSRGPSLSPNPSSGVDPEDSATWTNDVQPGTRYDQGTPPANRWQAAYEANERDEQLETPSSELPGSTTLLVDQAGMQLLGSSNLTRPASTSYQSSRPRLGVLAALGGAGGEASIKICPNQDDLELAEFEALEQQIRKDLGHGMQRDATQACRSQTAAQGSGRNTVGHAAAIVQGAAQQAQSGQYKQSLGSWSMAAGTRQPNHGLATWDDNPPNDSSTPAALNTNSHIPNGSFNDGFKAAQPTHSSNSATSLQPARIHAGLGGAALAALGFDDDMEQWDAEPAAVQPPSQRPGKTAHSALHFSQQQGEEHWEAGACSDGTDMHLSGNHVPTHGEPSVAAAGDSNSPALVQPFVRSLFANGAQGSAGGKKGQGGAGSAKRGAGGRSGEDGGAVELAAAQQRINHLEQENAKLVQERTTLAKLRTEMERAMLKLEADKQAAERKQASDASSFESWRAAEVARLERDRRVLDKQSKALLKLPNKKERSAVEALEAVLEEHQREARATAARHKLQLERLRRQLLEQQEKNRELREEVRWHEARQLGLNPGTSAPKSSSAGSQQQARGGPGQTAASGSRVTLATCNAAVQAELGTSTLQAAVLHAAAEQLLPHLQPAQKGGATKTNAPVGLSQQSARGGANRHDGDVSGQDDGGLDGQDGMYSEDLDEQDNGGLHHSYTDERGDAVLEDYQGQDEQVLEASLGDGQWLPPSGSRRAHAVHDKQELRGDSVGGNRHNRNSLGGGNSNDRNSFGGGNSNDRNSLGGNSHGRNSLGSGQEAAALHEVGNTLRLLRDERERQHSMHKASTAASKQHARRVRALLADTATSATARYYQHSQPAAPVTDSTAAGTHSHPRHDGHLQQGQTAAYPRHTGRDAMDSQAVAAAGQRAESWLQSHADRKSQSQHSMQQGGVDHDRSHSSHSVQRGSEHRVDHKTQSQQSMQQGAGSFAGDGDEVSSRQRQRGAAASREVVQREVQHEDGKRELFYASGRRDTYFSNGTLKVVMPPPEGLVVICFSNGDVKHQLADGTTQYHYAEVGTWHTTYAPGTVSAGVEVFHFPTGQAEAHHPGGYKEVLFADGLARRVWPDGREQDIPRQLLSEAAMQPCPSNMLLQLGLQ